MTSLIYSSGLADVYYWMQRVIIMCKYSFEDVKKLYNEVEQTKGIEAYKYIDEIFEKAKVDHKKDFLKRNPTGIHEQSWHPFKGNSFEKLIQYIIIESIEALGMKMINGNQLERRKNLSLELSEVKRNLVIDYGEFGLRLPDADIVVYNPEDSQVIAIISSKTSLAERVAQTGYWKFKLQEDEKTKHIKVYLITPDGSKDLRGTDTVKKSRVIAEVELDGTYVLTTEELEESNKVKLFEHFIEDFKKLIEEN